MRIAVLGNLANVGHNIARYLSDAGLDVTLILKRERLDRWRDWNPDLDPQQCSWLRVNPGRNKYLCVVREGLWASRYDLLISVGLGGMWYLPMIGKPYVSYATGADLRELAAGIGYPRHWALQAQRVFRAARLVFYSPDHGQIEMTKKLQLRRVVPWRQFVDTAFWKPSEAAPSPSQDGLRICHPTNLKWSLRLEGQSSKANDVLFRGFRQFLDEGGRGVLYYLERGQNVRETTGLIRELRLEPHVRVYGNTLDRNKLREFMLGCDVVADQFGLGCFGLTALEAMSLGKPTIGYADPELMRIAYPPPDRSPPILNARNPPEVAGHLHALLDSHRMQLTGTESRKWIEEYHDPRRLATWYWQHIEQSLSR